MWCIVWSVSVTSFSQQGLIVYVLTVLSDSVYPAGSTSSAHWTRSPLFIHSFPRGQVLSLWWMGAGTGQLFSLDGTSLTRSELKRPPCQRSSAIPVLFRGPHTAAIVLTRTRTPGPPPDIPGAFLIRIYLRNWVCSLQFNLHRLRMLHARWSRLQLFRWVVTT